MTANSQADSHPRLMSFHLGLKILGQVVRKPDSAPPVASDLGADYMGELSRLNELTRFAELTRFLYVLSIILTFRLHAKRVVRPPCRDRGRV